MAELKETKGYANFKGIIGGLDVIKNGKAKDYQYKDDEKLTKMQFSIKTSEDNMHYIQLIQFKMGKSRDQVWIVRYDKETKKSETTTMDWSERNEPLHDGWRIIGVDLKAKGDDERKSMVAEDAIEYIKDNFNDGDSVFIGTQVSHREYKDKTYDQFDIKKVFATKDPVDFEAEDFEEIADFNEQFVFDNVAVVDNEGFVKGYSISYNGDITPIQYVVRDKDVLNYFKENVNFGDLLKAEGIVNNRVVYKYRDAEKDEEDSGVLVGKQTKSSKQNSRIREVESEDKSMEIIGLSDHVKGAYTEEDLGTINLDDDDSVIPF